MRIDGSKQVMFHNDCLEGRFQELVYNTFIAPVQDKCKSCATRCYIRELNNWFNNMDDNLALYGCGQAAENLVGLIDSRHMDKIRYYSDKKAENKPITFNGMDVLSPIQLRAVNPSKIILCSEKYAENMKEYLSALGIDKSKLVELDYDIIKPLSVDFANNICPSYIAQAKVAICNNVKTFDFIHDMNNAYDASGYHLDKSIKERTLLNLIFGLLSIRDVVNVKKRINEYIEGFDTYTEVLKQFSAELDALIQEAAYKISCRKSDAIIIYLIDAMPSALVDNVPYLEKMKRESICFNNAYTEYCWTTCSFQTIFSGKDLLKDKTYNIGQFSCDNSPFIKAVEDSGYTFHYSSTGRPNLFDNKHLNKKKQHKWLAPLFWDLMNELSSQDKDSCYFMHIFELHDNSSALGRKYKPIAAQLCYSGCWMWQSLEVLRTLSYINEQFSFFDPLLSNVSAKVVMSDHGNNFDRYTYLFKPDIQMENSLYTKTTLFVNAPRLCEKGGTCDGLFGYKDFYKLMEWVFGKRELQTIFSDYLRIYALPYYGKEMLDALGKITSVPMLGIVTSKGIYWFDYNGNEIYYPNGCNINMINNDEYAADIDYARCVCGKDFYSLLESPKFALAKEYLLKYGKIKEE